MAGGRTDRRSVGGPVVGRGAEIPGRHPGLEGDAKLVRTMRFADAAEIERRRDELAAVVRASCDWRDG